MNDNAPSDLSYLLVSVILGSQQLNNVRCELSNVRCCCVYKRNFSSL